MPIPRYDQAMAPILRFLADGRVHTIAEIRGEICKIFKVTPPERELRIPSAPSVPLINDRVHWARYYLWIAGLVIRPGRGTYAISDAGKAILPILPAQIDKEWLVKHCPPAAEYFSRAKRSRGAAQQTATGGSPLHGPRRETPSHDDPPPSDRSESPQERFEYAYDEIQASLISELKSRLASCDPTTFEIIITRLLVKMGYANDESDIVQLHGKVGDGGIDGKVRKDPLGLEQVYMQAKRWKSAVPLKPVVDFHEVVKRAGARTGVFVARSGFNEDAREWIDDPEHSASIAWIDGNRLAELLVEYRVGVEEVKNYSICRVDENMFSPESD